MSGIAKAIGNVISTIFGGGPEAKPYEAPPPVVTPTLPEVKPPEVKPPEVTAPTEVPVATPTTVAPSVVQAKKTALVAQKKRTGRLSTIFTDTGDEKLG